MGEATRVAPNPRPITEATVRTYAHCDRIGHHRWGRANLSGCHPASTPRAGPTGTDRPRSWRGLDLRSCPWKAVAVRSDKLRDAEVVPLVCQIVKPAEHSCGHDRSVPSHRPAPELAQHRRRIVYRPLELVVEGRRTADMARCPSFSASHAKV
jgi:hypothetical protein